MESVTKKYSRNKIERKSRTKRERSGGKIPGIHNGVLFFDKRVKNEDESLPINNIQGKKRRNEE